MAFGTAVYRLVGAQRAVWRKAGTTGAVNEVQSVAVTGAPTGGTFTLTFNGQTTSPIPHNATSAQVQAAVEGLANVGFANVTAAGGPLPATPVTVTFVNLLAGKNVGQMTATASLTGGTTPAVAVTTTTQGQGASVSDIQIPRFNGVNWDPQTQTIPFEGDDSTVRMDFLTGLSATLRFHEWAYGPLSNIFGRDEITTGLPADEARRINFGGDDQAGALGAFYCIAKAVDVASQANRRVKVLVHRARASVIVPPGFGYGARADLELRLTGEKTIYGLDGVQLPGLTASELAENGIVWSMAELV